MTPLKPQLPCCRPVAVWAGIHTYCAGGISVVLLFTDSTAVVVLFTTGCDSMDNPLVTNTDMPTLTNV